MEKKFVYHWKGNYENNRRLIGRATESTEAPGLLV